jgi:segregation and condensation protein B
MSKRKGRRQPQTSEIKSILRGPPEGETELEGAEGDTDGAEGDTELEGAKGDTDGAEGDTDEAATSDARDDAESLDLYDGNRHDAEAIAEPASEADEPATGADGPNRGPDPEAMEIPAPAEKRSRRLRAVRARDSEVTRTRKGNDPERDAAAETDAVGTDAVDADTDTAAVARWGDDGGPASDADHDRVDPAAAGVEASADDADDDDGGESFAPAFTFDGAEGDDTEGFLRGLVEALLFTSQKPLDLKDVARSAGIDKPRARELLEQLQRSYEGHGLCIEEVAGGFVMRSSPRYAPYIQKILAMRPVRLSRAQLETLAIVAYRQPVTKPEVDDIRGVDSGQVIKGLLERSLLKMLGKKDEPGRPTLYGTTNDFLELLNLQSLKDLPTLREYTELSEESQRKFLEETGEAAPSEAMTFERPPARADDESAVPIEPAGAEGHGAEGPPGSMDETAVTPAQPRGVGGEASTESPAQDERAAEPPQPRAEDEASTEPRVEDGDAETTEPRAEDDGDAEPSEPGAEDERAAEPADRRPADDGDAHLASTNGEALNGSDGDHEAPESSELEAEAPEADSDDDDVASEEDVVASEEDVVASEEDVVASEEDDVASEEDDVASEEDDVASEEDDVASEEDDVASEEDDVIESADDVDESDDDESDDDDDDESDDDDDDDDDESDDDDADDDESDDGDEPKEDAEK